MQLSFGLVLLALLMASAPALAQPASLVAFRAEAVSAPVPTLVERYGPDDARSGSLRLPTGKGPFPVAVLIHGGCWTKGYGDRGDMEAIGAALADRGIAVWNIAYRRVGDPDGGYPGTFEDVGLAIDHLAVLAQRYPLDLSRVTYVGHSTGGQLALWAAARRKLGGRWAGPAQIAPVSVVDIDGPPSPAAFMAVEQQFCGRPVVAALMGSSPAADAEHYRLTSADEHLPLGARQLLVSAALAPIVDSYAERARTAGDTVDVLALHGADHFAIATPGTPEGKAVIEFIARHAFAPK